MSNQPETPPKYNPEQRVLWMALWDFVNSGGTLEEVNEVVTRFLKTTAVDIMNDQMRRG